MEGGDTGAEFKSEVVGLRGLIHKWPKPSVSDWGTGSLRVPSR